MNLCSTITSFSDVWADQSISHRDWLVEGRCRPDDKRDGKWTWSGFDMMSANAPIDQKHWHPSQNPGRWGCSRQAAEGHSSLSQHCPITLRITPPEKLFAFFPWRTDDNHSRSIVSRSLLISGMHAFLRFCSHLYLKKCQIILLVKVSNYNVFGIKSSRT